MRYSGYRYLSARRIVYGQVNYECGPNGLRSAQKLSASLLENGVELMRFKTGTPARIDARSLDYSKMEPQYGDEEVRNFSFISDIKTREQVPCYLTYTNEATHKIIRDNLHLSGMYNGMIEASARVTARLSNLRLCASPIRSVISCL